MTSISASLLSFVGVSSTSQTNSSSTAQQASSTQTTSTSYGEAFNLSLSDSAMSMLGGGQCDQAGATDSQSLTYSSYSGSSSSSSSFEDILASLGINNSTGSSDSSSSTSVAALDTSSSGSSDDINDLLKFIEKVLENTQDSLSDIVAQPSTAQNTTTTSTQAAYGISNSDSSAITALDNDGPLPNFLKQVDAQLHLDSSHAKALQDIATQYQNANDTPDTVQSIAAALQTAGIG